MQNIIHNLRENANFKNIPQKIYDFWKFRAIFILTKGWPISIAFKFTEHYLELIVKYFTIKLVLK